MDRLLIRTVGQGPQTPDPRPETRGSAIGRTTDATWHSLSAPKFLANVLSRQASHGHRIMTLLVVFANYASCLLPLGTAAECHTGCLRLLLLLFGFISNFTSISQPTTATLYIYIHMYVYVYAHVQPYKNRTLLMCGCV